jgi:hypothetical protein
MHRVGIGDGMNRDGADAHFVTGAMDAERNLSAIGNQDFFKHPGPSFPGP